MFIDPAIIVERAFRTLDARIIRAAFLVGTAIVIIESFSPGHALPSGTDQGSVTAAIGAAHTGATLPTVADLVATIGVDLTDLGDALAAHLQFAIPAIGLTGPLLTLASIQIADVADATVVTVAACAVTAVQIAGAQLIAAVGVETDVTLIWVTGAPTVDALHPVGAVVVHFTWRLQRRPSAPGEDHR